jgi:hypothetical protein
MYKDFKYKYITLHLIKVLYFFLVRKLLKQMMNCNLKNVKKTHTMA